MEQQIQPVHNLETRSLPNEIAPQALSTPEILSDHYEFVCLLGNGSQGRLYKAIDKRTHKSVAIKQLRIDLIDDWKSYTLFEREAKILSELELDGVAKFHEYYECLNAEHPCAYLVQDYIDGLSIEEQMTSGIRYSVSRVFEIALQLVDILEKLHTHEPPVIHRDLKPGNIMICQENGRDKVYLIDFGAVANPQIQGGGSTVAGTYGYMPPEQLMGRPVPASDIYALAATICYMLSGVCPADMQTLDFKLIIEPHLQSLPNSVSRVLSMMLAPAVKDRLTDYETIRCYFNAFKNSKFDIFDQEAPERSFYDTLEYEEKLSKVKTLWDDGNLQLWEALPDQTPRALHSCMNSLKPVDLCSHKSLVQNKITRNHSDAITFLVCFFMGGWCILMTIVLIFSMLSAISTDLSISDIIGFLCIGLVIWWLASFVRRCFSVEKPNWIKKHQPSSVRLKNCQELMKYGRKTIAIITNISYKTYVSGDIENYQFKNDKKGIYLHNIPRFEISYKFNPPDDSQVDDLVHRIIVHRDPGEHLHVGDPLPILYEVSPENNRRVQSMPFPFAACDVHDIPDMICVTLDGFVNFNYS